MVSCSVDSTILCLIPSWIGLSQHTELKPCQSPDRTLSSPFHCTHEPRPCAHFYYQIREQSRQRRLYAPMLIPAAPSASAATNPRLSAIPPEAIYGTFSSSAARASCITSIYGPTNDCRQITYQHQTRNILLARMSGACHECLSGGPRVQRFKVQHTFKSIDAENIYPHFLRGLCGSSSA